MPVFHVRKGRLPLFGCVEANNQEPFFDSFSNTSWPTSNLDVDDVALDLIAVEFDEDLDGSAAELERYCAGKFRAKTKGPGGNRLGNIGEALVWLSFGGPQNGLVRVVSWKPASGPVVQGTRYVQPDFLELSGATTAVEVKSTEQLVFREMASAGLWQRLRACAGVSKCRSEALEQIGLAGATVPNHKLVTRGGAIVPFPAGSGAAIAVLVRDGRTAGFQGNPRFRQPPQCRLASTPRDCWKCMSPSGQPCDITIVRMDNQPGHLPLAGGGESGKDWAAPYARWSHAIWSRNANAVSAATQQLTDGVRGWVRATRATPADRELLLSFWGSYLSDVACQHGMPTAAAQLPTFANVVTGDEWRPAAVEEPTAILTSAQALAGSGQRARDRGAARLMLSDDGGGASVVLTFSEATCSARGLAVDARLGGFISEEQAVRLAGKVTVAALVATGWLHPNALSIPDLRIPLRAVKVTWGKETYDLGWVEENEPTPEAHSAWRDSPRHAWWWPYWEHKTRPFVRRWAFPMGWLPRCRVRVTRSGRCLVDCTIPKT